MDKKELGITFDLTELLKEFNPREPLDDNYPDGYMQSDKDFVNCNLDLCVFILKQIEDMKGAIEL